MSIGESFQILRPSSTRDSSRRVALRAHLQPVLEQDDPGIDQASKSGTTFRNFRASSAETHHPLTPARLYQLGPNDDLAGRRQVRMSLPAICDFCARWRRQARSRGTPAGSRAR
jgi:hypothetical protein